MNEKIHVRVNRQLWTDGVEILITQGRSVGVSIVMKELERGLRCGPTLTIENSEAQELIDGLWASGLRPSEGSGSAGSLKATENHLADMRLIAMNRLKIEA